MVCNCGVDEPGSGRDIDLAVIPKKFYLCKTYKEIIDSKKWAELEAQGFEGVLCKNMGTNHVTKLCPYVRGLDSYCEDEAAEWCYTMAFLLSRKWKKNQGKSNEDWEKGFTLTGKKCLVIGSEGSFGSKVKSFFEKVGLKCTGFDLITNAPEELANLVKDVKVIVVCVGGGAKKVLEAKHFRAMEQKPILINPVARPVIHSKLIKNAISSNQISGYAYDEILKNGLEEISNVILTPHILTYTNECEAKKDLAWQKLKKEHGLSGYRKIK